MKHACDKGFSKIRFVKLAWKFGYLRSLVFLLRPVAFRQHIRMFTSLLFLCAFGITYGGLLTLHPLNVCEDCESAGPRSYRLDILLYFLPFISFLRFRSCFFHFCISYMFLFISFCCCCRCCYIIIIIVIINYNYYIIIIFIIIIIKRVSVGDIMLLYVS